MPRHNDDAGFRSTLAFAGRRLLPIVVEPPEFAGGGHACGAAPSSDLPRDARASHNGEAAQSSRARAAAVATYELLASIDDASARGHFEHRQ